MTWKLCYIDPDHSIAFFANVDPVETSGDDWDDAPWEYNSEQPYQHLNYDLHKVMFDPPSDAQLPLYPKHVVSVDDINAGQVPWMGTWAHEFWAGMTLDDFKGAIRNAGGEIYTKEDDNES